MGRKLYAKKGCAQCHSIDGSAGTGPSFKGIYGEEAELTSRLKAPRLNPQQPLFVSAPLKQTGRVMVKDEDLCVHCGLCAERCPTAAWDMQKSTIHLPHAIDQTWPSPQRRKTA